MRYLSRHPETGKLERPFAILLATLVAVLLIISFAAQFASETVYMLINRSLVLITFAGAYSFSPRKRLGKAMFVLGGIFIPLGLWGYFLPTFAESIITLILLDFIFLWLSANVIRSIFSTEDATLDTILGAFSAFLLIGLSFGLLHAIIELFVPNSYIGAGRGPAEFSKLSIYYSYVTLTTLGFGDITPVQPLARTVTYLEAVLGQGFIAVIVARFVGMEMAESLQRKRDKNA